MTDQEIADWKLKIDNMTHVQCANLWRFSPSGHPVFDSRNGDLFDYFSNHFKQLGGMTPEISKSIGW